MPYADIDASRGDIIITTQWTEKEVIKAIPGAYWDAKTKCWRMLLAWGSCVALRGFFQDSLTISEELVAWATEYRRVRVDRALAIRSRINGIQDDEQSPLDEILRSWRDVNGGAN